MSEPDGGGRINGKACDVAFDSSQAHRVHLHVCEYGTALVEHPYHDGNH